MARHELTAHVRVQRLSGLYECDACGQTWSFVREWAEVVAGGSLEIPSKCCGAQTEVLTETIIAIIDVHVGPAAGGIE